jgi:hypothetical protein
MRNLWVACHERASPGCCVNGARCAALLISYACRMTSRNLRRVASALTFASVLALPALAFAEASVAVFVRTNGQPTEATVTITDDGGHTYTCVAREGTCEITGLTPGRHTIYAENARGRAESRSVLVVDGKVSIYLVAP